MQNLLEFLLIHLVDHPESVKIEEIPEAHTTRYILHVHPEDMGRVIGKKGSVIDAIRKIAKIRAIKENLHVTIDVAE
ncbi:MAG TPA: KH domain-containing protein [Patescibacteria group bacterium]